MAIFDIRKEKERIVVTVSIPALPPLAVDAEKVQEVVREENVRRYLEGQNIKVYKCLSEEEICNLRGPAKTGIFIYSTVNPHAPATKKKRVPKTPPQTTPVVKKVIKDLTSPPEPVIIEEQPKKRKRVKRDSKTGNQTTS